MSDGQHEVWVERLTKLSARQTHVALFVPNLLGGGAERVCLNLARALAEAGLMIDLVLVRATGPLLAQVPSNVRVVDLHARGVMRSVFPLSRYLRLVRPAVLLSALDHANVGALLARGVSRMRTRVIISIHSVLSHRTAHVRSFKARFYQVLMRQCYPWADSVVAVSRGVKDEVCRFTAVRPDRVRVIYNPVISAELYKKASEPVDHPWLEAGQPKVILSVGSLSPWKDHDTLIRAFSILRKRHAVRLMILGDGVERPKLENLVRELRLAEDVSFLGFVENPYRFMVKAAALALSSKWESFSMVLVEAMALNVPVVSTDCDYGPREVLGDGHYGTLVPVGDVQRLADALDDVVEREGLAFPRDALKRFTFDHAAKEYLKVIFGEDRA